MSGWAEITVGGRRAGAAAWHAELWTDPDDDAPSNAALTVKLEPAVAFLSERGGGLMVLPL